MPRKKLVVARYGKNKFGIGYAGGPASYFVRSDFNEMDREDEIMFAEMIQAYNEKHCSAEVEK